MAEDTGESVTFDVLTAGNPSWTGCALRSAKLRCLLDFQEAPHCSFEEPEASCTEICALATERHNALELEASEVQVLATGCRELHPCNYAQCVLIVQIDDRRVVAGELETREYDCHRGPEALLCGDASTDAGADMDASVGR